MSNKKENTKVDELTGQTQNQSAELTDDGLDNVSGGYRILPPEWKKWEELRNERGGFPVDD